MSHYATVNFKAEVIERVKYIDAIKENYIDALAELQEVRKMDPTVKTKSSSEIPVHSSGGDRTHPAIILSEKKQRLEITVSELRTMINDFERGWRMLSEDERHVLSLRYQQNHTVKKVSEILQFSEENIYKIQSKAIRKMENYITRF